MEDDVKRGLALLSKKNRTLHPRAQVQSLKRIATRALNQSERVHMYSNDRDKEVALLAKARDATAAMRYLNREHNLGYLDR